LNAAPTKLPQSTRNIAFSGIICPPNCGVSAQCRRNLPLFLQAETSQHKSRSLTEAYNFLQEDSMSLRDFNSPSDDPIALHNSPQGNGAGLGNFHTINPEDREPNNTPKIVGALAVALIVGVAGIGLYSYSGSASHPKPIVASNNLPSATPAPPASQPAAMTPDTSAGPSAPPAPAPAASMNSKPAPVKSASARSSRHMTRSMAAATVAPAETSLSNPAPQQHAAAVPEPVSPAPSPNDVAVNNSRTAAPATAAQDNTVAPQAAQSSTPQASNTAPAQDQQTGATPAPASPAAPAQSAGQVAQ
jgi:hypothetical protein